MGAFLGASFVFILLAIGVSAIPLWVALARRMQPIGGVIALLAFSWFLLFIPFIGWLLTILPWFGALIWASAGRTKPLSAPGVVVQPRA